MTDLLENNNEEQDNEVVEAVVVNNNDALIATEAYEREVIRRKLNMSRWAEKKKMIYKAPPNTEDLDKVYDRLREGKTIEQAIEGVCSYYTWRKWREEYEEIAAMEEDARNKMVADYQERQRKLADGLDLDGQQTTAQNDSRRKIDRARLQIDTLQKQIERVDRLTEARMNLEKQNAPIVPIQINVKYGKPKPGDPDYVPEEDTTRTEGQKSESNTTDNNK